VFYYQVSKFVKRTMSARVSEIPLNMSISQAFDGQSGKLNFCRYLIFLCYPTLKIHKKIWCTRKMFITSNLFHTYLCTIWMFSYKYLYLYSKLFNSSVQIPNRDVTISNQSHVYVD